MYETEYHFLFRQVNNAAKVVAPEIKLLEYYGLPNIARRLVETFLAYRLPDCEGELYQRFERVNFDPEKKTRILRFLHTYSHCSGISEPEHDPSVLSETPEIMKLILEMMKATDIGHFQGMENLMKPIEEEA
jgi:wobble nucleotide-excising tRNase